MAQIAASSRYPSAVLLNSMSPCEKEKGGGKVSQRAAIKEGERKEKEKEKGKGKGKEKEKEKERKRKRKRKRKKKSLPDQQNAITSNNK